MSVTLTQEEYAILDDLSVRKSGDSVWQRGFDRGALSRLYYRGLIYNATPSGPYVCMKAGLYALLDETRRRHKAVLAGYVEGMRAQGQAIEALSKALAGGEEV